MASGDLTPNVASGDLTLGGHFLEDARGEFRKYKRFAEKAVAQIADDDFYRQLDSESNSIAIVMKHIAGNLHSRWREFLTTDGEKPDRNRDSEFEKYESDTKERILERWEAGWQLLFEALSPLSGDDLQKTVTIRGKSHTVLQAINRQLTHYASHVGQIVFLAKHFAGDRWRTLSIPRGKSREFEVTKEGAPYRA